MIFNSITFLIFMAVFYPLLLMVFRHRVAQNVLLLLSSWVFYAWWDWRFLSLIMVSIGANHLFAKGIHNHDDVAKKKRWLTAAIVFNLGLLATFKYFNFFVDSALGVLDSIGLVTEGFNALQIILPVGISFYTFQGMSYVIDVYDRKIAKMPTLLEFGTYISLFPQLVAGPIVRAAHLIPQLQGSSRLSMKFFLAGVCAIIWGYFLKLVLAEHAAVIANWAFENATVLPSSSVLLGVFAFAMQIYGDFAGYSLIAIGLGYTMGLDFDINFRRPYFSASFSDLWRRWHISLSSWLRDYLYIRLGGNRGGNLMTYRNLMLTMLLGGLWHGAAWNFVYWGFLHGLYLALERMLDPLKHIAKITLPVLPALLRFAYGVVVFIGVCYAWIYFRAEDWEQASNVVAGIGRADWHWSGLIQYDYAVFYLATLVVLFVDLFGFRWTLREDSDVMRTWPQRLVLCTIIFFMIMVFAKLSASPFIYFQF